MDIKITRVRADQPNKQIDGERYSMPLKIFTLASKNYDSAKNKTDFLFPLLLPSFLSFILFHNLPMNQHRTLPYLLSNPPPFPLFTPLTLQTHLHKVTYRHGEIRVLLVVCHNVSRSLIQHREKRIQSSHFCEVHHVFEASCKLQTFQDKAIGRQMWRENVSHIPLKLRGEIWLTVNCKRIRTRRRKES